MDNLICHRGIYDKNIRENSYEGILKALNNEKYVGVEFDVRETKDNELILFHNAYYNNKLVSKTYFKDMPKYTPRLQDVLKIKSDKIFLIEIKNIQNNYNKFINIVEKYKKRNIYVMSFSNKQINKIDIENRSFKIGILNYVLNTNVDIKKYDFVAILYNLLNDRIIEVLEGKEIFAYGIFEKLKYKDVYYILDDKDI